MSTFKQRLARAVARLIVSDPVAVEIVAKALPKPAVPSDGAVWRGVGEIVITANPGVTPEAIRKAIEAYDGLLRKNLPAMVRDAERRFT